MAEAGTADQATDVQSVMAPACVRCGRDGEHDFVDFWICTDCYGIAGASCAGLAGPSQMPPDPVC